MTTQALYPNLKFYYVFNSSFTQFLKLDGIVLWPFVFISTPKDATEPSTLKHELTHVAQVRREGPIRFYGKYLFHIYESYRQEGSLENAFISNEFEDEAYGNERNPLTDAEIEETKWEGARTDKPKKKNKK